jgi:glycosyltransferase involved in cell wall biosynthesis
MRLLLVGAFAFPHTLGSAVYLREQARALRDAGADVHLLTYGPPPGDAHSPEADADLDGIEQTVLPVWTRPSSRRSGPSLGKPVADLALAAALRRVVAGVSGMPGRIPDATPTASSNASKGASSTTRSALRRASSIVRSGPRPAFDAILAHHAEATLAALHLLPRQRPPVVYCAHTLLEEELPEYLNPPTSKRYFGSKLEGARCSAGRMTQAPLRRAMAATGRVIDRGLARRAEAWIALTQSSARVIETATTSPGRWIAPPVADLANDSERPDPGSIARAFGLPPDGFFLYAGNLDPYQDLPLLERVAGARKGNAFPIVVATHDETTGKDERSGERGAGRAANGLLRLRVRSASEANALVASARASIVPRRSVGGFPIKLLNSLALGTPVVAFHGEEWGLVDGANSIVCDLERPEASLLAALSALESDGDLARRLGRGARATWIARHQPDRVAADTLDLIAKLG